MIKFKKGDKIEAPSGDVGLVLKRRGKITYMFWPSNLDKKLDNHPLDLYFESEDGYGWGFAHVFNQTEDLINCKKIGTYTKREYETYKVLYGDNK